MARGKTRALQEASEETLQRLGWSNFFDAIESLCRAPGCEFIRDADLTRYATGVPYSIFNGVFHARLEPTAADARIAEIASSYRARDVSMCWIVDRASRPEDLGQRLEAHGFARDDAIPAMAIDLERLPERNSDIGDVVIEEVRDLRAMGSWAEACKVAYEFSEDANRRYADIITAIGFQGDTEWRHYLALLEERPVAMASLFLTSEVAGIYNVGTIPDARRRGIAGAITLAALRDARGAGYRYAVLQATETGYPVYARLGFREVSRVDYYAQRLPETVPS